MLGASGESLGQTKHHEVLGACEDPWDKLSTIGCLVLVENLWAILSTIRFLMLLKDPWAKLSTIGCLALVEDPWAILGAIVRLVLVRIPGPNLTP